MIYIRRKSYSAGGVQVRLERITEHAKINHHLGRFVLPFSRALVLRARFESGRHDFRKRLYCILRRSDCQSVRSTAQAVKTPYKAKYKRKRHKKIIVH